MKIIQKWFSTDTTIAILCLLMMEIIWYFIILASGSDYSYPESFIKWDSFHYLEIASSGYTFYPCSENPEIPANFGEWCGNAGWMPLYPLFIRIISIIVSAKIAAVVLSRLFFLFSIVLMIKGTGLTNPQKIVKAIMFCLFPGMLYSLAAFPVSLTILLLLIIIRSIEDGWRSAGITAAILLPWSYASAFLCIPALIIAAICSNGERKNQKHYRELAMSGLVSYALTFFFWHYSTGHWNAFFLVQEKYGYGLEWPIITWFDRVRSMTTTFDAGALQTLAIPLILVILIRSGLQRTEDSRLIIWLPMVILFWIFPLSLGGSLSLHRAESLLSIGIFFFTPSKKWISGTLVCAFFTLYLMLLWVFVRGNLV